MRILPDQGESTDLFLLHLPENSTDRHRDPGKAALGPQSAVHQADHTIPFCRIGRGILLPDIFTQYPNFPFR